MNILAYPSPEPPHRGFVGLPQARIEVVQHADGRWMWAHDFMVANGGGGYAALPKWGNFAATEAEARDAGIAELRARLSERSWADHPQARLVFAWLDSLEEPVQGALF